MKVAVSTDKGGMNDKVFPMFGKSPTFTIVDTQQKEIKDNVVIKNPGASLKRNSGILAAKLLITQNVDAVITGNCSPRSHKLLFEAKIKVYQATGKVKDAVKKLLDKKLPPMKTVGIAARPGGRRPDKGPRMPPVEKPGLGGPHSGGGYL